MQIAGIQKLTLVDFPGHVAAIIFTRGCNFRCGFCHNPELVIPEQYNPLLSEKEIFDFLETRYGKLTGICITGGEPTLHKDCDKFISHMKALGFDVKLDTNGSNPQMLKKIIADGDVDYIAMDIKSPLSKYDLVTGTDVKNYQINLSSRAIENPPMGGMNQGERSYQDGTALTKNIQKSIKMIMSSGIPYEFRTTICHPLHELADFHEIGEMIKGADKYFIQNFVKSKHISEHENYSPFTDYEIEESKNIMTQYVKEVKVR